ncbi:MAG: extracellular solute-binding protein [Thermomicrobiales bacterium]|nr:extracellular solute-binding protein [Thermomicrobiales bacterium]
MKDQLRDADRTSELMALEPAEVIGLYRSGRINRRDVVKLFGAIGMAGAAAKLLGPAGASAATDLNAIVWEGYTAEAFAAKFETENDAKINSTFMSSSDEAFGQLQAGGGGNFDLVSASNDLTQRLVDAALVQEIDPTKLTNFNDLHPAFQRPDYITFNDKLYGANFAWGPTVMLYNTEEVAEAPTSWNALLDERYKGKIATWGAPIQIAQYALLLDPKPEDPYVLTDEQLAQVKDILLKQRPLVRAYWAFGGELAEYFINGEVIISDAWPYATLGAKAGGSPVAEVWPSEGVTGWSDSWMITSGAKNVDLCYKWIDYMIGPDGQNGVLQGNNYAITNQKVIDSLDPELKAALYMDDIEAGYAKILMWKNVPNMDKWLQVWTEATQG